MGPAVGRVYGFFAFYGIFRYIAGLEFAEFYVDHHSKIWWHIGRHPGKNPCGGQTDHRHQVAGTSGGGGGFSDGTHDR